MKKIIFVLMLSSLIGCTTKVSNVYICDGVETNYGKYKYSVHFRSNEEGMFQYGVKYIEILTDSTWVIGDSLIIK